MATHCDDARMLARGRSPRPSAHPAGWRRRSASAQAVPLTREGDSQCRAERSDGGIGGGSGRRCSLLTSERRACVMLLLALVASAALVAGCMSPQPVVEEGAMRQVRVMPPTAPARYQTPAEATDYVETATFDQVEQFLGWLSNSPAFRVGAFGTTVEGRPLPLAVWDATGAPRRGLTDAAEAARIARASGKTRVLVIGGIHAGEPAGKDAMLALMRDLAAGRHAAWADSLVLVVAPLYNADGNERVAFGNRPLQWGPLGGVGVRPNAQGLDLNRDFVKAASPEARAMVALIRDLDPHLVIDLHTTNGTAMGYHLTYAPGLHPDTPAAISADLYGRWLPSVSDRLLAQDGFATFHYGNVPGAFGEAATAPRGWYSFSAQPRFSTNYAGLRGRYAVLSEAYSYASFQDRVEVSRRFVEEILDRAWAEASRVRQTTADADRRPVVGERVAVRAGYAALAEPAGVLLGEVDTLRHPLSGDPMLARRDVRTPEVMPAYVRFQATESTVAPQAYLVRDGPHLAAVRDLLDLHGVRYRDGAGADLAGGRQAFQIDSVQVADRPYQGVRVQEVFGAWRDVPDGSGGGPETAPPALVVPLDQPLGRLAVAILEPRSPDGVVAWAIVGPDALPAGGTVPIERIPAR